MNRYRTLPGGPPKASATTTCQKCLKKDNYECKAGAQERPYISRPSRTQQLLNPKLKPRLTSDTPNELLRKDGVADEELARSRANRDAIANMEGSRDVRDVDMSAQKPRSQSVSSAASISTISTDKSRSISPSRRRRQDQERGRRSSRSNSRRPKRKHRDFSSPSHSRSPPRSSQGETHKSRRYGRGSPDDRGRPTSSRRGSHRDRTDSNSIGRSEATRNRRSMDGVDLSNGDTDALRRGRKMPDRYRDHRANKVSGERDGHTSASNGPNPRRERSLSPFSKRLALTQAMNTGR